MIEHRVGTSRQAEVVHLATKLFVRPMIKYCPLTGPIGGSAMRLMPLFDRSAGLMPRLPGTTAKRITARTWRGEVITPLDGPTSDGAVLYIHGGAFMTGGTGTHRRIVERLSRKTGMTVLSIDYRQLPQGRLHDSISDCQDAFSWLVRQGHSPAKVVIAGDSAGGHLAFATALRVRDEGPGAPAGIVGLSPWLDFDHMAKLRHHNSRRDAYIPVRRFRQVAKMVVGDHPELHHSPVNADLRGLPPTLIICAEGEVLRVDAELMAERLTDAGVPCTLQIWEGQIHAFPVAVDLTPEGRAALHEIAAFATEAVAAPAYRRGSRRSASRLPTAVTAIDVA